MKKNFDQKIDEMLVVLNAAKKPKASKGGCEQMADPVTCAMNDALKSLGFTVVDKSEVEQPELDGMEDIEGRIEDLDLPRPAEDEGGDDEDDDDDGDDSDSGGNPFDPLGDGVEDVEGNDENGDDNGDGDETAGGNGGVEDENDSDELKIKRLDNGDVVFSFGGNDVTVTRDNLSQIVTFLGGDDSDGSGDSNFLDDDSDGDDGFGDNGNDKDDTDDEEDD